MRSKYGAVKTICSAGHKHDSKREAARCDELRFFEKRGHIRDLEQQPRFQIVVGGIKICTYVADFRYTPLAFAVIGRRPLTGERVVEDVKGVKTAIYRLKKKLVAALYGVEIRET